MMEVCQTLRLGNVNKQLSQQTSTDTISMDQPIPNQACPAWCRQGEHPTILGIASAISSRLSIYEDWSPEKQQQICFSVPVNKTSLQSFLSVSFCQRQSDKCVHLLKKLDTFNSENR